MKKSAKLASCYTDVYKLDIGIFSSNQIVHKISFSLWFLAPDPLIYKFYKNLSNNRSGAQKQRLNEILWKIWYDEETESNKTILYSSHRTYHIQTMHTVVVYL